MYKNNKTLVFSPSDLTIYLNSSFASWMERACIEDSNFSIIPDESDPFMSLLANKGFEHEIQYLNKLKNDQNLNVIDIREQDNSDHVSATLDAMQQGYDIIFQATLESNKDDSSLLKECQFKGHADYLKKVSLPSQLGDYSYEVWDAKLATHVKPYFIVQLCCYAQLLEQVQGIRPKDIVVILGDGKTVRLKTDDYFYYYKNIKAQFLKFHQTFDLNKMEDPANSKEYGQWSDYALHLLEERDHLSLIANITQSQIKKMEQKGVKTCLDLTQCTLPAIPRIQDETFARLKKQATIQIKSRGLSVPLYDLIPNPPEKYIGLSVLPPHSDNDIFFDIEGFPLVDGGLEYLWGSTYFDADTQAHNNRQFKDFWAHDQTQEKSAFVNFIQWAYARWESDPNMHIYHYGHYEITVCRKLMGRYGACEQEVDQLLRNEVFVDCYNIVRNSLYIGEPKYSIKNVEHLYREQRDTDVAAGGDSVVVYDAWRVAPDGEDWQSSKFLNDIRDYNIDDCNSTQELVSWLRDRQAENDIQYLGKTPVAEQLPEEVSERIKLRDRLLLRSEQERKTDPNQADLTENLAWVLEFHRREAKPFFWRLFDRFDMDHDELLADQECLACCIRTDKPAYKDSDRARNTCYEYQFDIDQEFKGVEANYWYLLGGDNAKVNMLLDDCDFKKGLIVLKTSFELDNKITLIPDTHIRPKPIPESIDQVVALYETKGEIKGEIKGETKGETTNDSLPEKGAIYDFLKRTPPNIIGLEHIRTGKGSIIQDPQNQLNETINAVVNLDHSYLPIQGPPGTGKTYTAARIIERLVSLGKKIAITSNSHQAINNLLLATAHYFRETGTQANLFCTRFTSDELNEFGIETLTNSELANKVEPGCVIGTTAWGFSRDDLADQFDYLFVDEAGQVSIARLIAMSRCCENLVLMGDQMQLSQPIQGSHPKESGLSILDYLLHEQATISDSMGIFLNTTYRMHSNINSFINTVIYEGKLQIDPANDNQSIRFLDQNRKTGQQSYLNKDSGIVFVPVPHDGNTQSSMEEVSIIKTLFQELIGKIYTDKLGNERPININDILIVAPYNQQVNYLQKALGEKARIGSVDKFQGQEAPIVFLSMCTSDANESPRGIDFVFDIRRINVAISRAKVLAIVVGHADLLTTRANSPEQMKNINLFSRLVDSSH